MPLEDWVCRLAKLRRFCMLPLGPEMEEFCDCGQGSAARYCTAASGKYPISTCTFDDWEFAIAGTWREALGSGS